MDIATALGNFSLFYTDEREVNFLHSTRDGRVCAPGSEHKIIIFFNSAQREMFIFACGADVHGPRAGATMSWEGSAQYLLDCL
jgi:hypothetical protein